MKTNHISLLQEEINADLVWSVSAPEDRTQEQMRTFCEGWNFLARSLEKDAIVMPHVEAELRKELHKTLGKIEAITEQIQVCRQTAAQLFLAGEDVSAQVERGKLEALQDNLSHLNKSVVTHRNKIDTLPYQHLSDVTKDGGVVLSNFIGRPPKKDEQTVE